MTASELCSIRELDHRFSEGIQVRLLWSEDDDSVWVSVFDIRDGRSFRLRVRAGERALDVFHHPFAYAAHHGVADLSGAPRQERVEQAA